MSDLVLIASPVRHGTPQALIDRNTAVVEALTYPSFERVVYPNRIEAAGRFGPNAAARNELLDRFLRDDHQWVLWMDIDIIEAPADLIERLMISAEWWEPAMVAPSVWVERISDGPAGFGVGGWFYDIGGFVDLDGRHADFAEGVLSPSREPLGPDEDVLMQSVGCVYLAPASLYRQGLRYRPDGDEVEHLSFCRAARAQGVNVVARRDVDVVHAYLPKWGEAWHG